MKKLFTLLLGLLRIGFVCAQNEPIAAGRWLTTIEMGVQTGRVRPDNLNQNYGYWSYYPAPYYSQRPAGNRVGLTIHAFSGYTFTPSLHVGLSTGVDYYNNSAFFPVAATVQGNIFKRIQRLTPFYCLESGYAFRGPNPHEKELKGGWLWSPGIGLRINKGNGTGFLISAGYKHQQARHIASVDGTQTLSQVEYRRYNRLFFRMGFSF
ncbi:hypothetical protein HNV11_23260 [Spirosoma taeanense]|uniref:Outer membrane protein beta-barrel domain-containing protein n=1 Tax=Spirosoma taeanense TaxID=2735870 RepID=A0A6M5YEQ0_9BACT|nr:hypothetical protein [Spirosoma taeanense]QJW92084.1 hypothetical protein HNV11_23260 [Spirosoma taeanense]